MRPENSRKTAPSGSALMGVVKTQNAAASAFKVSSRTISAWKAEGGAEAGFRADGTVDLGVLAKWCETRRKSKDGAITLKDSKTLEEVRKLRLANDSKEGRLVERAWVSERMQRAAVDLNSARAKSEAEHATKFAATAGDVAACRSIVRGIWDDIFAAMSALGAHFEEGAER